MPQEKCISTHKIIIFLVFIIASVLSSLFIYRFNHPTTPITLGQDAGTRFPVPRDLSDFKLQRSDGQPFTQDNLHQHWTLLFFGFTHCASICPTTLDLLQRAYTQLHPVYPNLQVVLVSLDPQRDNPAALASYVHGFHPDFIGVTGQLPYLRKFQSQFGVFAARDNSSENNYQLQHTSSIMLINPEAQWVGLFRFGLTPQQLSDAFRLATHPA